MKPKKSPKGPKNQNHASVTMAKVNENLELLRDEIGDFRLRMAYIEAMLHRLEKSNALIADNTRLIKNNIKTKVDLEEFMILENRLVIFENRLAKLEKKDLELRCLTLEK